MTKEEVYLILINSKNFIDLKNLDNFFLEEYDIAKIFLKKFDLRYLSYPLQETINKDAYSEWLGSSHSIKLHYEVSWLSGYMPSLVRGSLSVLGFMHDLYNLREVQDKLICGYLLQKASNLEVVGGNLLMCDSSLTEIPNLKRVEGIMDIRNSKIKEFPKLEFTKKILINKNMEYWEKYFAETGRAGLFDLVK